MFYFFFQLFVFSCLFICAWGFSAHMFECVCMNICPNYGQFPAGFFFFFPPVFAFIFLRKCFFFLDPVVLLFHPPPFSPRLALVSSIFRHLLLPRSPLLPLSWSSFRSFTAFPHHALPPALPTLHRPARHRSSELSGTPRARRQARFGVGEMGVGVCMGVYVCICGN
jgi:hypothetical protein